MQSIIALFGEKGYSWTSLKGPIQIKKDRDSLKGKGRRPSSVSTLLPLLITFLSSNTAVLSVKLFKVQSRTNNFVNFAGLYRLSALNLNT